MTTPHSSVTGKGESLIQLLHVRDVAAGHLILMAAPDLSVLLLLCCEFGFFAHGLCANE